MMYTPIRGCDLFVYKHVRFLFCDSFVKMTSKVLYSNSNEISSLIESTSSWSVFPLGCLDDPDRPASILLFDTLFYQLPVEWTVNELLEKRPEWEQQILPLLKARYIAYLFTSEWCVMAYRGDKIVFKPFLNQPIIRIQIIEYIKLVIFTIFLENTSPREVSISRLGCDRR